MDLLRVFRDTHPDKLRALGADADAAAVAIVASLNAHADSGGSSGRSSTIGQSSSDGASGGMEGGSTLECGALEMLTDLCSATDSGVASIIAAGGVGVALAALERQTSPAEARAALSLLQAIQSDPASGMAALQDQAGECVPVLLECVKK